MVQTVSLASGPSETELSESKGGGGSGVTRVNFFLVGSKDPKILALTNFLGGHFPVAHEATQQG